MKGITYCGACADYDIKKHRCKRGAKLESNPQDKFFDDCPLPDVELVRNGRWEHKKNDYSVAWCSKCKGMFDTTWHGKTAKEYFAQFAEAYRYCPRCGAKMDLEDEKNDN